MCWFFFFKQKTAYELRISDWSSDVCSSDLAPTVVATNPPADAQIALPQPFLSITFDQDMFVAAAGQAGSVLNPAYRSEERRGGKECGSTCRYRLSPHN